MSYESVIIDKKEKIGIISLNRPKQFNTFSTQMAGELNQALFDMDMDDDVRVVVVKGEGKAFSTGIDVNEYFDKTPLEYAKWISLMDAMHQTIAGMTKPVIAMVHGFAVANGAGLLAAADFAIIAEGTKIGTTAINVGLLCTGPIIPLSYSLSKKKALEMLLSGDMISAEEALHFGLVNRVVPADILEEETFAFAEKIINKSPIAVEMGKTFYYRMIDMPFRQRFDHSKEVFTRLCTTDDAREGITAFIEKRIPRWTGK